MNIGAVLQSAIDPIVAAMTRAPGFASLPLPQANVDTLAKKRASVSTLTTFGMPTC